MHIAVCMDVAADRKQMERLLGRSTDRRIAQDNSIPFYIQSYGNKNALFRRPFMYDLFLIDVISDEMSNIEIIRELRRLGVTATIVLCPSTIDFSGELTEEDNVLILKQPIVAEELEKIIDCAVEEVKSRVPKVEIRNNTDTLKVPASEIDYIEKCKEGVIVHLNKGGVFEAPERLEHIWECVETIEDLYYLPDSLIVNSAYVKETHFGRVVLKNGKSYRVKNAWIKFMKTCCD